MIMTRFIDNPKLKALSEAVFYLALLLEVFYVFWDKSELTPFWDGAYFRVVFCLTLFRVLTVKRPAKEWICLAVFTVLGIISWKMCGRNEMLRIIAWIAACKGMEMKKVMKVYFLLNCLGCAVLASLSVLGIFGKVALGTVYRGGDAAGYEVRYCLGMGHPNALHCMALMLTVLALFVFFEKLKLYHLLLLFLAQLGLFLLTDSRMGFLGSVFSLALAAALKLKEKYGKTNRYSIFHTRICAASGSNCTDPIGISAFADMPQAAASRHSGKYGRPGRAAAFLGTGVFLSIILFSIACAARQDIRDPFWWDLNYYTNGRIQAAFQTANLSAWSLFGAALNTSELDMGFVRLFYWYGFVPALCACLLGLYGLYFSLREKEYASALMILSLAVYTLFEAHLVSPILGRNPLILLMGMLLYEKEMLSAPLRAWKNNEP